MVMRTQDEHDSLPEELESPRAKLVYMYISVRGEVTVEALQDALDIDKITLFSILKTLDKRGLVRRSSDAYRPA